MRTEGTAQAAAFQIDPCNDRLVDAADTVTHELVSSPTICTNNRPLRMSASSKLAASKLAQCRVMPRKFAFERSAPFRSVPFNTAANMEIPTMEAS